jgi:hypothetical protein
MSGIEFTLFMWALPMAAAMFMSKDPEQSLSQLIGLRRGEISPRAVALHSSSLREHEPYADEEGFEVQSEKVESIK